MKARCPSCHTLYRIDPRKVPPNGVRARCSFCGEVFRVLRPPEPSTSAAVGTQREAPARHTPLRPQVSSAGTVRGGPPPSNAVAPAGTRFENTTPTAPGEQAPTGARSVPLFGATDPEAKARRLARALVSDIVTYHPDRRARSLAEGTLKEEFRDEIRKSWEEYVAQVGVETANESPHFREALNELLAGGQQMF